MAICGAQSNLCCPSDGGRLKRPSGAYIDPPLSFSPAHHINSKHSSSPSSLLPNGFFASSPTLAWDCAFTTRIHCPLASPRSLLDGARAFLRHSNRHQGHSCVANSFWTDCQSEMPSGAVRTRPNLFSMYSKFINVAALLRSRLFA
jgi:hypothetical protein